MNVWLPKAKADPRCSCVEGHYECGFCRAILRQKLWRKMSERDRAYDRYVDPINSSVLDRERDLDLDAIERGCSCHINPPCSFCTSEADEQESGSHDQQ